MITTNKREPIMHINKSKTACPNINCKNNSSAFKHFKGELCDNCKNLLQNNKCDIHVCMECGDISEIIVNNSLEEATYLFDSVCNWCYALKYSNIKCRKSHFYNYTNPFIKEPNYAH